MAPGQHMSHSPWHLALRNFITQIKNKLNNLIVSTFLLFFVNKIMFTKCFFLLQKGFLFVKWVLFLLKMCFFPWKGAFFKCFFLPKSTTIPDNVGCIEIVMDIVGLMSCQCKLI